MPKLYIENGPDRGKSYVITTEGPFFAGRDSAAQVPILDEMASRRHFQIEVRDGAHHVRDLGSSNGTQLNGRPIKGIVPITSNDRIQVGTTNITFIDEKKPSILGTEISGYRILDRIGRGGMGTVYRALQTSLDRVVALKILAPHLIENTNFVNLFIREARAAGALSHPNVVQVYDVGVDGDTYFFSMEYIPHGTVEDLINADGALPLDQSLRILRDAAIGLQYAEQKGIIHRDIKPGNLMVGAEGIIKIGDLGIARSTEGAEQISQKDGVSGSPHYIAPEQARGQDIDHRVDIYALGVSLYQMISGKTPYSGSTPREVILKHIKEPPPRLSERVPDCPDEVVRLVHRMMAKDPDSRPASATTLLSDLQPLLEAHTEGDSRAVAVPSGSNAKKIVTFIVGGILLVCLAGGGMLAWASYSNKQKVAQQQLERWQDALAECEEGFSNIRAMLDNKQLAGVATGIERIKKRLELLGTDPPPEDLTDRHTAILDGVEQAEKDIVSVETGRTAAEELTKILADLPTEFGDPEHLKKLREVLAALEEFQKKYQGKSGAEDELRRAKDEARSVAKQIGDRGKIEGRIRTDLDLARDNVEAWLRDFEYDTALERLEVFPEQNRFGDFKTDWNELHELIVTTLKDHWNEQLAEINQHLDEGKPEKAERIVDRFARKTSRFEGEAVRQEILDTATRVAAASEKTDTSDRESPAQLFAKSLAEAWEIWRDDFSPGSYRAGEIKKALTRHQSKIGADAARLAEHLEFLNGWQAVREKLAENVANAPVPVGDIANLEDVTLLEINFRGTKVKLRKKKRGAIVTRSFDKLSAQELATILCAASRTAEEHLYTGFWARLAGNNEASDKAWEQADSGIVKVLEKLLESRRTQ